jgi:hypothetical protein
MPAVRFEPKNRKPENPAARKVDPSGVEACLAQRHNLRGGREDSEPRPARPALEAGSRRLWGGPGEKSPWWVAWSAGRKNLARLESGSNNGWGANVRDSCKWRRWIGDKQDCPSAMPDFRDFARIPREVDGKLEPNRMGSRLSSSLAYGEASCLKFHACSGLHSQNQDNHPPGCRHQTRNWCHLGDCGKSPTHRWLQRLGTSDNAPQCHRACRVPLIGASLHGQMGACRLRCFSPNIWPPTGSVLESVCKLYGSSLITNQLLRG